MNEQLTLSLHADGRIRQRGIPKRDLALVVEFGLAVRDGYVLRGRDAARAISDLKRTIARLERLAGTFVAVQEDTVLSVYRPTRARRRKVTEAA